MLSTLKENEIEAEKRFERIKEYLPEERQECTLDNYLEEYLSVLRANIEKKVPKFEFVA